MREIKFRCWFRGEMIRNAMCSHASFNDDGTIEHMGKLMQYTGLKDKNGKEIYEGDILKYKDGSDVATYKVFWDDRSARFTDTRIEDGDSQTAYDGFEFVNDCKVIGNIHEHPELLK
jgi:uncharacterized phage protein (TIGR01671 family)